MANNIFTLLGLPATATYEEVNRERKRTLFTLHPDKNRDSPNRDELTAQFTTLQNEWEKVDSEEKFNAYVAQLSSNAQAAFEESSPSPSMHEPASDSDAVHAFKHPAPDTMASHDWETVYFSVPFTFFTKEEWTERFKARFMSVENEYRIRIDPEIASYSQRAFLNELFKNHLSDILTSINRRTAKGVVQVGITQDQAVAIATQHSMTELYFVVAITLPLANISFNSFTEKDIASSQLNAKNKIYSPWVSKATAITANQICIIFPPLITEQLQDNTMRTDKISKSDKAWWYQELGRNRANNHSALIGETEVLTRDVSGAFLLTSARGEALAPLMLTENDVTMLRELYKTFRTNSLPNRLFTQRIEQLFNAPASVLHKLVERAKDNPSGASARTLEMYGLSGELGSRRLQLRHLALGMSGENNMTRALMP